MQLFFFQWASRALWIKEISSWLNPTFSKGVIPKPRVFTSGARDLAGSSN